MKVVGCRTSGGKKGWAKRRQRVREFESLNLPVPVEERERNMSHVVCEGNDSGLLSLSVLCGS